jgi:hypothetical protein
VSPFHPELLHPEEDTTVHLIAADTAFQLARDHHERLRADFPRRPRRRRRPTVTSLPGSPPDAA